MKKLIAMVISFILMFGCAGYCAQDNVYYKTSLRVPVYFGRQKDNGGQRIETRDIKIGRHSLTEIFPDLNSDRIAGLQIPVWLREHGLFSNLPPLSLNRGEYGRFINRCRSERKLKEVKAYILNYAEELYGRESEGYKSVVEWIDNLKKQFNEDRKDAESRREGFKHLLVDYLTGRAGPHMERYNVKTNISPLEWAAQGRFFWQVHQERKRLLFGSIDITGMDVGDLPIFPVDAQDKLIEHLTKWMINRGEIPPFEYYEAKKMSLRQLLKQDGRAAQMPPDFGIKRTKGDISL